MNFSFPRIAAPDSASCVGRKRGRSSRQRRKPATLDVQSLESRFALSVAAGVFESKAVALRSDTTPPEIRSVTPPKSQTYAAGRPLSFKVNFTERVVVTGAPTLPIAIGDSVRQAAWNGRGSGGSSLVFTTVVQPGDFAPDGVQVAGPITLPGGAAISDRAGNPLIPTASGTFPRARVDAVGPSVTAFGPVSIARNRVSLQVTFTEPVTVKGKPSIPFTLDGVARQLVYKSGSRRDVLTFEYRAGRREVPTLENVVVSTQAIALGRGRITDRAGNVATSLAQPTGIALSATSIAENAGADAVVGVFSTTDPDAGNTFTYTLVPGTGSTDNASFTIFGSQLRAATSFDFETKNSYAIRVRSTDQGGLFTEQAFTIMVTDVNEAPAGVSLTNTTTSLPENTSTATRIKVADIVIADDALGTNTVTLTGADAGSFEVEGPILYLTSGVPLDFQAKASFAVTVNVTDESLSGSTPVTVGFTLNVTDVNEAPTDITLSATSIAENAVADAVVGMLSTTDPDAGNTFTYTLVPGTGDTDNASFTIFGSQLRAATSFDFETKNSYAIRVRSTDQGGLFIEKAFTITITVTDVVEMQFVVVGDAGNGNDPATALGAVNYHYLIGTYEVTIRQYATFLNAVAKTDLYGLYSAEMGTDLNIAGIARSGEPGSYTYTVMNNGGDSGNRPITYVSWFDAARFANWMHNGQGTGDTETGAYTLNEAMSGTAPARDEGATFFLPTEDEWYKAAYYSPIMNSGAGGYFAYATQSDTVPGNTIADGANQANYYVDKYAVTQVATYSTSQNYLTEVGAFANSTSGYGTFDQTGNVREWNESIASSSSPGSRGGGWGNTAASFVSSADSLAHAASFKSSLVGFRLARPVADPFNRAPTDIALSATSIAENAGADAVVGVFSTTDPDAGNTFTYTLVSGDGSTDNAAFNILGSQLRAAASFDFETKNSYSVRVRSTDQGGLFTEKQFTIAVTDLAVEMAFVTVGDTGNQADSDGYGTVDYQYQIGTYEVTIGQYVAFLNAVAADDPYGLYNPNMASNLTVAGISRTGSAGSYTYSVIAPAGMKPAGADSAADRPITYVSWFDAARFANWMHNGQGTGDTETGAYTLNEAMSGTAPARDEGATFFLPTEDEWYKAAYYSPIMNSGAGGYFTYATQSNTVPGNTIGDGANQANYSAGDYTVTRSSSFSLSQNYLTNVGAFTNSSSYYGTFDQSGNVWEWSEAIVDGSSRGLRGGAWGTIESTLSSSSRFSEDPSVEGVPFGFRLARLPPA